MRNLLLSSATLLLVPAVSMAAPGFITYTHTDTPIELKSISDISSSLKLASICFLGVGDCDPNAGFGTGDDYGMDTVQQCLNEGYTKQNCNSVQTVDGVCPYNSAYGLGCKCAPNLVSCPAGQTGVGESCGGKYVSCQCDPALVSCASNQVGQGASCGGRYESCGCKPEYKYTSSNCSYPRSVSGASCGGQYTGCDCPSGAATNIIRRPVLRFAKAPMPTTVRTGKRSLRRTAVQSIGKTVRPNAKRLITTIVGTGPKFPASSAVLRILGIVCPNASPVKTTTAAIVRRLMRRMAAKLTGATVHRNVRRLIRTIAETKWRLSVPVRQMQPVPTFPTVPPKSVPGTVTTGNECVAEKKGTCEDYGYSSTEPLGKKCRIRLVPELSTICYTDDCKQCQLNLKCVNGCAKYNMPENSVGDIYGCPRVCVSCNKAPVTKPDCGSQSLISCNGTYYCCEPRFASCYYTTPHDGPNGTTTYVCSVAGKVSSSIDGVVEGVTAVEGVTIVP